MSRIFDTGEQRRAVKASVQQAASQPLFKYSTIPFSFTGVPKRDVKFISSSPGFIKDFVIDAPFINPEDGVEINIQVIQEDSGYHIQKNSKDMINGDGIVVAVGDKIILSFPGKESMPEEEVWIGFNFYIKT